ncbi:MAG: DUF1491 family protein [Rhodospirillaceae bacterium]|nr:DUF1491 family protein [Rhodospirillaceae bacterium]
MPPVASPLPRLKADMRVQAWLRRAASLGLMATVARKGEQESGTVMLKLNRHALGCDVFSPVTTPDGTAAWMSAFPKGPAKEKDADAYLQRQAGYDPDLWVVEIEDPKGLFALDAPVMKD